MISSKKYSNENYYFFSIRNKGPALLVEHIYALYITIKIANQIFYMNSTWFITLKQKSVNNIYLSHLCIA